LYLALLSVVVEGNEMANNMLMPSKSLTGR